MKKVFNFWIVGISSFFILGCSTPKTTHNNSFQSNPPFKVIEASYTKSENDLSNRNELFIYIVLDNTEIKLDTVYFRNNSAKMKLESSISRTKYIGHLISTNTNINKQFHNDPKKEYGNRVPDISQKIPFNLKANEAVVSYIFNNNIHYFKILNCIETKLE